MAFFEELENKLQNEEASQTASLAEEKNRLEGLLTLLGIAYYDAFGTEGDPSFAALTEQIAASMARIEELQSAVSPALCPICGKEIVEGAPFCPYCGRNLLTYTPEPVEETAPEAPAEPVEESVPEVPAEPEEEAVPEVPAEPVEEAAPEVPAEPVEEAAPEVPAKPVEEAVPEAPAEPVEEAVPEAPAEPEAKVFLPGFCTECGEPVDVNSSFCTNCGSRLTTPQNEVAVPQKEEIAPVVEAASVPKPIIPNIPKPIVPEIPKPIIPDIPKPPVPKAIFCRNCGTEPDDADKFCTVCGTKLER